MEKYKTYLKELYFLIGDEKKHLPFLIFIFLFSSFLDLAGIGLIAPYISIVLSPETFKTSNINTYYTEVFGPTDIEQTLLIVGSILLSVFILKLFLSYQINKIILKFSYNKVDSLRADLLETFQSIDYQDYLKRNSSDYIYTILTLTANFAHGTLNSVLRILSETIVLTSIFLFLLLTSGLELFIFICVIGAILFFYDFVFRRKLIFYGRFADNHTKELVKNINESVHGLKEIRVLGKEDFFHDRTIGSSKNISFSETKTSIIKSLPRNLLETAVVTFVVISVFVTIKLGKDINQFAITLGMFAVAAMRLIPSTNHITAALSNLGKTRNAISLLYNDLKFFKGAQKISVNSTSSELNNDKNFQSVELEDVSFSYGGARIGALSNISLEIEKGDFVGIMGPSGSGKSTLVDIILGLLPPEEGSLKVNGEEISRNDIHTWLHQIAYIPQSIFITDDSLKNNIALGTPEEKIDENKVLKCIEKSNLRELVEKLPKGVNTSLGEKGINLSGGQRQRVAIARALYYNRDILILDEATSALDNELESEIIEEIKNLKGEKTIITIAHRLTTLKYCDRIYNVVEGKIAGSGSYEDMVLN